jgi:hypothetical protein
LLGFAVAISDVCAIAGAPYDDDNGTDSGSVYMYKFCPAADMNGDCKADAADLAEFVRWWLSEA